MPSLRDPTFETEVLAALMRRRLFSDLGLALAASLIGAIALGVLWPVLAPTLASLGQHLAPAAIALTAAVSIAWMAPRAGASACPPDWDDSGGRMKSSTP